MQQGIGAGRTRADHRRVANLLYARYAKGRELRRLEAIVGRDGMLAQDRVMLDFADAFERELVHQGTTRREVGESLDTGMALLKRFHLET